MWRGRISALTDLERDWIKKKNNKPKTPKTPQQTQAKPTKGNIVQQLNLFQYLKTNQQNYIKITILPGEGFASKISEKIWRTQ